MSKESERNRKVQLLAVNSKYKERTGFLVPLYDGSTRKYVTGLEQMPAIERGKILKALGVSNDPDKGLQIDELQVPITHRQVLDLSEDEDYGIYCLCQVSQIVAKSSKSVNKQVHLFFINDVEVEAETELALERKIKEAKDKIFDEANMDKLKSLCVFLGGIDIRSLSLNSLMARALKEAERRPDEVLKFYEGKSDNKVFILELYHYGIIQMRQGKYYDGEIFLGVLDEAIDYVANPKNSGHVSSLGTKLLEKKKG